MNPASTKKDKNIHPFMSRSFGYPSQYQRQLAEPDINANIFSVDQLEKEENRTGRDKNKRGERINNLSIT